MCKSSKKIMKLLQEVWRIHPNMRFFQLIDFLIHEYSTQNNNFGRREGFEMDQMGYQQPIAFVDLYYLEDAEFEQLLRRYIENE